MINIIVTLVIVGILGLAIRYIVRAKQRGVKCIGCPAGQTCKGHCSSASGCASGCESGCACSASASASEADVTVQTDRTAQ